MRDIVECPPNRFTARIYVHRFIVISIPRVARSLQNTGHIDSNVTVLRYDLIYALRYNLIGFVEVVKKVRAVIQDTPPEGRGAASPF